MDFFQTPSQPSADHGRPSRQGEPAWEEADGATWREIALSLVEVDQHRLYEEEGWRCTSTAQRAKWEYGFTPAETEEVLRIGRKLLDLPEIDRAFCDGWLTWEHVVVLTRVAVPKHEAAWLQRALVLPSGELALLVERSVEGWAPPVVGDRRAQAGEGSLGWVAEAFLAPPSSRRARLGDDRVLGGPRRQGRIAATGFWREDGAPNVRHRPDAPPSTS